MLQYQAEGMLGLTVLLLQVKAAEHVVTGHQVAVKILNRRKIRSMDMDEKGKLLKAHIVGLYIVMSYIM